MKRYALLLLCVAACHAQQTHPVTGREIAHVMSAAGADWLERPAREAEEHPREAIAALRIAKGATVADVGAGSGYLSRLLAAAVGPTGTVWCSDIQPRMLEIKPHTGRHRSAQALLPRRRKGPGQRNGLRPPSNSTLLRCNSNIQRRHNRSIPPRVDQLQRPPRSTRRLSRRLPTRWSPLRTRSRLSRPSASLLVARAALRAGPAFAATLAFKSHTFARSRVVLIWAGIYNGTCLSIASPNVPRIFIGLRRYSRSR